MNGQILLRRIVAAIWLAMLALASVSPATAQRRVALVVGNDSYTKISALQKARNDARAVSASLVSLGFEVVTLLDATRSTMAEKLSEFENRIAQGDIAFFFFAGHGVAVDGANYLLPTDMPMLAAEAKNRVKDEGFMADRIAARLQERGAKAAILVLDACRDNPFKTAGRSAFGASRGLTGQPIKGVFVLYSAGIEETALDRLSDNDADPNSIFTRHFIQLVGQPGMSLVDVSKAVQARVLETARTVGRDQMPAYYDQVIGQLYLGAAPGGGPAPLPSPVAPVVVPQPAPVVPPADPNAQLERAWKTTREIGTCGAYSAFLAEFPNGFEARLAKSFIDEKCRAPQPADPPVAVAPQPKPEPPPARTFTPGPFLVVAGSYQPGESGKAQARLAQMRNWGFSQAKIVNTSNYPNLTPGLLAVVIGPYSKNDAETIHGSVRRFVRDAFVKSGF